MHTFDFLGKLIGMAASALDRIESAAVFALIRADMAVETFRRTVRRAFELSQIEFFMAIDAGIFLHGVGCLQPEQQTGNKDDEELAHSSILGFG